MEKIQDLSFGSKNLQITCVTWMCILMWLNLNVEAAEDKYTKLTLRSTHPGWTAEIGRVSKHTPSTNSTSNF